MHILYSPHHRLHATDQILVDGRAIVTDEVPERAETILRAIQNARLGPIDEPSDHGLHPILSVHEPAFVRHLRTIYEEYATFHQKAEPVLPDTFAPHQIRRKTSNLYGRIGYYACGAGTPILEGTWVAVYWGAQCALSAVDRVLSGDRVAYALCRPPGHHAASDLYGGFCYLNNAAISARYLQIRRPGEKVAILDIDYHHGNGTQEIFYTDPSVLFCSLHAHPDDDYPYYWGASDERGEGAGEGYNRNWTLPQGAQDADYMPALNQALGVISRFNPSFLILSAGFDIIAGDPLGNFRISPAGLIEIGRRINALNLPTIIIQEGGYLLSGLGDMALSFLKTFD
jgi:acetoin utilization deacetylase AcuC-like enzyme